MAQDTKMLNQIHQTTQMGQIGIEAVIDRTRDAELRKALRQQLTEYGQICETAGELLHQHGATAKDISPMAKLCSKMASGIRRDHSAPKIAEMMIQGNTRGMVKSMHAIRQLDVMDPKVQELSNKLLRTEQANIEQMKQYL